MGPEKETQNRRTGPRTPALCQCLQKSFLSKGPPVGLGFQLQLPWVANQKKSPARPSRAWPPVPRKATRSPSLSPKFRADLQGT